MWQLRLILKIMKSVYCWVWFFFKGFFFGGGAIKIGYSRKKKKVNLDYAGGVCFSD